MHLLTRHAPLVLSFAVSCLLAADGAHAQTSPSTASSDDVLEYVIVNGSQVELQPDYAGGQVAKGGRVGLFGNLDLMETPFNSTNFTADYMRNLQARSVADVVQGDPGVRVARGFGNFQELYVVRGFPVYSDDMSYNGLYGLLPRQYVAAEFLERVEVFRGANSFLNGAAPAGSGIGGSFNLVPKRAPDNPLNRVTLGYENAAQTYLAADFARRFDDERFGVRANGVRRDGETSVDNQDRELSVLSLGVDFRGDQARFSADFGWQDHTLDAPRPSVTPSTGIPRAPDSSSNFAQNWTFSSEKDFFGVVRGEYDFAAGASVWAATGVRDGEEYNVLANPTSTAAGVTSAYRFDNYREDVITTSEVGVRGEFDTGSVGHRVSLQGAIFKLDSKNAYALSNYFTGFSGNLYDPTQVAPPAANFFTGGILFSPRTTSKIETSSAALADTMSFADERVLLTLGARYQVLEQSSYKYGDGALLSTDDRETVTPVFGAVWKASERYSLYANYIEGLVAGSQVATLIDTSGGVVMPDNAGRYLDPFRSKQYELGAKYDSGTLGATLAVFRVTQPSALLVGNVVSDNGEQRNQGIEVSVYGELRTGLRLLGGITALDAELIKTNETGDDVIGVADTQFNVGLDWDIAALNGASVEGRWIYTGSQAANTANTLSVPSWNRFDLGGRYALTLGDRELTVRLHVENVADEDYWASVGGASGANYLVLGAPRTFAVSASYDF